MSKPVAVVEGSASGTGGRVFIWTPDTDAEKAHFSAAQEAAVGCSGAWVTVAAIPSGVTLRKTPGAWVGGGALTEAVRDTMRDARDAAKAKLRELGYTVRATFPAETPV